MALQELPFEGGKAEFGLVGDSPQIQRVLETIRKLKKNESPVLITGESGVGKELVASAIHSVSPRRDRDFLPIDSASLSGSLMESELFGHTKGSFTGAIANKTGLARAADGGTLFFDEIGELNTEVQAKMLRLLQEGEVRPIGGTRPVKVDVRILAATNRDLPAMVADGKFREDLYYRLNVIQVKVPPLRDRKTDIPLLARCFIGRYAVHEVTLSDEVLQRFMEYDWPGNIRELQNVIRRTVELKSDPLIKVSDLPTNLRNAGHPDLREVPETEDVIIPLAEVEKRHILRAVHHTNGDVSTAALLLGISKTTLYRKLKAYRQEEEERQNPQRRLFG